MNRFDTSMLAIGLLLLAALGGCAKLSSAVDAQGAREADHYRLSQEPGDAVSVCDLRGALPTDAEVTVLGRIGGIENPWTEGEASFVISDPTFVSAIDTKHECGDECPYCAKESQAQLDSMAFVQMVDEQGRVVRTDARELLGVAEDQVIVVRGTASLNRGGHIVIAARGLYVRE